MTCVGLSRSSGGTGSSMGIIVALGILAGGAYAVLKPPMLTSTALVLLPQYSKLRRPGGGSRQRRTRSLDGDPRGDCEK